MVSNSKIKESVDAQCKFLEFFLEPVVDQITENVDLSTLPSAVSENKAKVKEGISDLVYDKEGLYRIQEGFDLIIENLDRIPGGQLVRNELVAKGSKLLDETIKAIDGKEELIA